MESNPGQTVEGDELEKTRLHMETLQKNTRQLQLSQIVLYIVLGSICGICGLTGLNGFLFYIASSFIITIATALTMSFDTKRYVNETFFQMFMSATQGQIMSFVTFWTLAYSLVYVY